MNRFLDFIHSLVPYSHGDPHAYGLHFIIGAVIQWFFSRVGNDFTGFVVVLVLAFGKEAYDVVVRKQEADAIDIVATVLAALLIIIFTR